MSVRFLLRWNLAMLPVARVVAVTVIVVVMAGYYQLVSLKTSHEQFQRVAPYTAIISATQSGVARSEHPELYASGARFGFVFVGEAGSGSRMMVFGSIRYAMSPVDVVENPDAERVVVFFLVPAEAAKFEAENRVRLLDVLSENIRVYQRERN